MSHHIIVLQDSTGELDVSFSANIDLEAEKKEHQEQYGEEIIASYPLDGSLKALGIIAFDSMQFSSSFGNQLESLLTKLVRDISSRNK